MINELIDDNEIIATCASGTHEDVFALAEKAADTLDNENDNDNIRNENIVKVLKGILSLETDRLNSIFPVVRYYPDCHDDYLIQYLIERTNFKKLEEVQKKNIVELIIKSHLPSIRAYTYLFFLESISMVGNKK